MKKLLLAFTAVTLLFSACKKDDDGGSGKKSILTSGKWLITSSSSIVQFPSPIGNQTVDLLATFPACQQDNLYIFNQDGTGTTDEGATKCSSSDPQQKTAGSWALINNDTQLTVSDGSGTSVTADIQTLDNTTLMIKYVTVANGITSTTVTTYAHR